MKVFNSDQILNVAGILQLSRAQVIGLRDSKDPMTDFIALLKNKQIISLLNKKIPTKTYHELNVTEKSIIDYLFKQKEMGWMKKKFSIYSTSVGDDIDKLERVVRDNTLILPEGLRKETLELIKRYREK